MQLFICPCVGSPYFQVLNRRKVSKTWGKIEKPCVCAEKVSAFSFALGPKVYFGSEGLRSHTHTDFKHFVVGVGQSECTVDQELTQQPDGFR